MEISGSMVFIVFYSKGPSLNLQENSSGKGPGTLFRKRSFKTLKTVFITQSSQYLVVTNMMVVSIQIC